MMNRPMISEETRDTESLARFVAAAMTERPQAWHHVELLKAACAFVERQRRMHGDCIAPGSQAAGEPR